MKAVLEERDDVAILKLHGKITIGEGDVMLRKHLDEIVERGFKKIIFDLKDVSYMDSSGVGELVACYTTVTNRDGQLRLTNLKSKIYGLLQLTALITVFQIYDSNEDALQSF
ncbi:MAG: STAS domain-containing protein [Acidobacteria bacterium]|nr:STAS domain-containing protein [Acidobacteriota bacterium]MCB9396407.1 STAS domain-containing protein [Acidobacteriota bacterium]